MFILLSLSLTFLALVPRFLLLFCFGSGSVCEEEFVCSWCAASEVSSPPLESFCFQALLAVLVLGEFLFYIDKDSKGHAHIRYSLAPNKVRVS